MRRIGPSISVHGLGLTEHVQGTDGVMALVNLALLTGNIGKPGSGVNPLRGQNNVQGAAHMGCDPRCCRGRRPSTPAGSPSSGVGGARCPQPAGLHLMQMMDAALDGRFKALWAIGYDVLLTNPNAADTRRALASLDLVIVQDLFLNETAREFGSVFLPACSSFEKDGTFMNAERRIQRVRKAIEPVGQARSDWEIICAVAKAMGRPRGLRVQQRRGDLERGPLGVRGCARDVLYEVERRRTAVAVSVRRSSGDGTTSLHGIPGRTQGRAALHRLALDRGTADAGTFRFCS